MFFEGELQSMVMRFLKPVEVARTASVSRTWKELVDDELLWKGTRAFNLSVQISDKSV